MSSESVLSTEAASPAPLVAPKTPSNPKVASSLKSTPCAVSSTATAAASGVPRPATREDAMPFLVGDLQSTVDVCFDTILGVLLKDVAHPSEASTAPNELLQKVLERATLLCNETTGEQAGAAVAARKLIAEGLSGYVNATTEVARYPPFVKLSNVVLDLLLSEQGELEDLLRKPDPSSILFHINHPQEISSIINGDKIARCPDIVIVTEASARAAFAAAGPKSAPPLSRLELMTKVAKETILGGARASNQRGQFPVRAILCNMEFKKTKTTTTTTTTKKKEIPPTLWPLRKATKFSPPKVIVQDVLLAQMLEADKQSEIEISVSATTNSDNPSTGVVSGVTSSTGDNRSSTGSKRKAPNVDSQAGSKKRRTSTPIYPAIVQSASYALESINRAAGVMKVINMIVEDGTLWIWFYDRQGAIQSHGLNWIEDFPRFVTLLAALQRFDRGNWGFHHELEPYHAGPGPKPLAENLLPAAEADELKPQPAPPPSKPPTIIRFPAKKDDPDQKEYVVTLVGSVIHERATLLGRATRVERVTVTRGGVPVPGKWVLKVAWPESTRVSEVEIINEAVKIGETDENVRGHLPELLCWKDLECTTAVIREALGLSEASEEEKTQAHCGPRTPRLLVSKELDGIETLSSDELLKAFRDVVDCHYGLWIGGIRHCDISPGNLMWNPVKKSGVLNDYDLSRMKSAAHSRNLERTGTIPFLSLDLLENNTNLRKGNIEPIYKHDCDSLKWAFLYCVERRSEVCTWLTTDMKTSFNVRTVYLIPRLVRPPFSSKHAKLSQQGKNVYWLLSQAQTAVINHNQAFCMGQGPKEYVGATDFELYTALKSSIERLPA
ncbi:hypothetical protein FIBSPDRAFT_945904 [Athelia psychrophila]|uniref:Fungal-type protein kinase domain-containing protein n=1 Tax=Athelia psychrophila TaxID=1759441 RepID=A0A166TF24_9AGAM|nr:hypothetical protein FIBSPDRAFT_945904 [Fibularhizoctonia sp. CBS 109695]